MLEDRYHLPVAFDHDNQSAALVEHLYENGRGYDDILPVSLGRGIGCGAEEILEQGQKATGICCTYEEYCQMTDRPEIDVIMCDMVEKLRSGILSTLNILNFQLVLLCMDCCYWPEKYIRMMEEGINKKIWKLRDRDSCQKSVFYAENTGSRCRLQHYK